VNFRDSLRFRLRILNALRRHVVPELNLPEQDGNPTHAVFKALAVLPMVYSMRLGEPSFVEELNRLLDPVGPKDKRR
jgi:hypothetical protein